VFAQVNAAGYGIAVKLNASAKATYYLSSTGSSWDIASAVAGSITCAATSAWHQIEVTYDPVAGKYYAYVDGVQDCVIATSALRICGGAMTTYVGACNLATVMSYTNGFVANYEYLPYCQHPNGTTWTGGSLTTEPDITSAGYSSDWFDLSSFTMKYPSTASASAGTNPTFSTANRVYLGEATTGASTVSSVVSYAFQGAYVGVWAAIPAAGTPTNIADNLGTVLKTSAIDILNITSDGGWPVGSIISSPPVANLSSGSTGSAIGQSRNSNLWTPGTASGSAFYTQNANTGAPYSIADASWNYRLRAQRRF
jgi:hypothetical protein